MTARADVVRVARSYLKTTFIHRARVPGVGLDCAGVVICTARALGLVAPDFDVPPYTMSAQGSVLMAWAEQYMRPVDIDYMQAGDVVALVVDTDKNGDEQHLGILGDYVHGGLSIIHASSRAGKVIETRLMFARGNRFAAAFALPGVE